MVELINGKHLSIETKLESCHTRTSFVLARVTDTESKL